MALALNNLTKVDMPINIETKPFPGLLHFTLDPYLIVKQGGIK